jgi:hypothetical protein
MSAHLAPARPSPNYDDKDATDDSKALGDTERAAPPRAAGLHRGLSARQVQMIAIAGTIGAQYRRNLLSNTDATSVGTGLFLGTGRSLAQGGPASMLICYMIVGFVVYVTLLLLGEMATQYPVAGAFSTCRLGTSKRELTSLVQAHFLHMPRAFSRRRTDLLSHGTTGSTMRSRSRRT